MSEGASGHGDDGSVDDGVESMYDVESVVVNSALSPSIILGPCYGIMRKTMRQKVILLVGTQNSIIKSKRRRAIGDGYASSCVLRDGDGGVFGRP